jgi:isocitrate dehydrogenase
MILSAVMMLRHLEEFDAAARVECAVLSTLEQGEVLTGDLRRGGGAASTREFTDAVIANLGCRPETYRDRVPSAPRPGPRRDLRHTGARRPGARGDGRLRGGRSPVGGAGPVAGGAVEGLPLRLKMISNRGTVVYPATGGSTDCVDHWRCRFVLRDGVPRDGRRQCHRPARARARAAPWNHVETLYEFDGEPSFTRAQGEN